MRHTPVLLREVLEWLAPKPNMTIVDCTMGGGGHSAAIVPRLMPDGRLIAMDCDEQALEAAKARLVEFAPKVAYVHRNFRDLPTVLAQLGCARIGGLLADLGMSSLQLDDPQRGFSFSREGPLDMRLDLRQPMTATSLIRQSSQRQLVDLFRDYGEERWAERIARRIVETRKRQPLDTTLQLARLVEEAVPRGASRRIHPATRIFQALRIAVNDELGALRELLSVLPDILAPGGRAAILTFHSLEDRLVKQAFRQGAQAGRLRVLTKKPVRPSAEEAAANPRSRSAKLRAAERP
ncbi:MAG: 16S rRNA (cytosine(1402)-N(4))-methyltransferase [Omnitrophica WOR_2 bacterium RIFCSPLOWO2_02_FULL_63_16]|nr:MAG: 16S rRNA (cytosine(1402)-N(4))-methyltransferase [Omnitrophica WOR_2 bacterium GWA2_63_20]OGX17266.1 MAG: 16S rRNA (cytosine(1402)-N(4))-methyltransferase [Omnitrophica WOR_2 bacterium GWF2_63_9]OGX31320.1 MAG: 16S rRNA (cytosine(1402)-N(4))-methyltransferase [Omnitrophica WOR_2 bacterium RIFCSPHIGHO2_12_FULL_64_13]OGX36993.1 MAG: 16S rRNA (cytosine(1402)-N(4))-methyltransferase [Omnitrophica WOR_2 bacterium RIFCSPHIGHO2_02_FULL_63_39]OGX46450.1 MAG: 16S rRNA (cytosine(1402)-N(4))-methy